MKLWEKYLYECGCEASEYNEVENGDEPKSVEDTLDDIEDEILEEDKKWIQKAIEKPGSLHRALGVPEEKKIPAKKLKVKTSDSPKMKKRKILANTLSKMRKK